MRNAENGKAAIDMAWESTAADFQATHERKSGQAKELKRRGLRVL